MSVKGGASVNETNTTDAMVSLSLIVHLLWRSKWLISLPSFALTVIAAIYVLTVPNTYRSGVLLAPKQAENMDLSKLASRYGGLLGFAAGGAGGLQIQDKDIGIEVLQSRRFIVDFVESHNLIVPLMASRGWDMSKDELLIDSDIFDHETMQWVRDVDPPKQKQPSNLEIYEEFRELLSINENPANGLITVRIEFYSPVMAKQWVDWLIEDINHSLMKKDVTEAERAVDYLRDQISQTSLASLQSVFSMMIEQNYQVILLAEVSKEYLFQTIDPAVVPELKYKPYRTLIVLGVAVLSVLIMSFGVILFQIRRSR